MLGLDTNVLVRFLVRDNESQFQRAQRLLRHEVGANRKVLISLLVLLEAEWVLRSRYGLQKTQIMEAIAGLLDATETAFEDEPAIEEALHHWKKGNANFADCLVGAHYRRLGCRATATFDTKALKVPGFVAVG
jgi:predicted nucleic-acid-binding protein